MGKKRRYRIFAHKFGRKYGLKYGLNKDTKQQEEVVAETVLKSEPVVLAAPEPSIEPAIKAQPVAEITKEDPAVKSVKKTTRRPKEAAEVSSTAPKKTRRKRTTRAKTES